MTRPASPDDGTASAGTERRRWADLPTPVVRLVGLGLVLTGVVHLLRPGALLATARVAYDRTLNVRFEPRDGTASRVRLAGVAMVAAGALLACHGGVVPGRA